MAETGHWPRQEDPRKKSILQACVVEALVLDKDQKPQDPSDQTKLDEGAICVICLAELKPNLDCCDNDQEQQKK